MDSEAPFEQQIGGRLQRALASPSFQRYEDAWHSDLTENNGNIWSHSRMELQPVVFNMITIASVDADAQCQRTLRVYLQQWSNCHNEFRHKTWNSRTISCKSHCLKDALQGFLGNIHNEQKQASFSLVWITSMAYLHLWIVILLQLHRRLQFFCIDAAESKKKCFVNISVTAIPNHNPRNRNRSTNLWCKETLSVQKRTCSVCSMALGKFFSVQIGIDFSGGSCDDEYDSVKCGITTCNQRPQTPVKQRHLKLNVVCTCPTYRGLILKQRNVVHTSTQCSALYGNKWARLNLSGRVLRWIWYCKSESSE